MNDFLLNVSCRGFTGLLESMERDINYNGSSLGYKLSIRDFDKKVTYTLDFVKAQEIKFIGGEVTFNG